MTQDSHTDLVSLIRHRVAAHPDLLLFRFLITGEVTGPRQEWTYRDLDVRARAIAVTLQEMRCSGQRALLLYPPGLDFIAAFLGCLYSQTIAVPLYPPDPTRLDRTLPRLRAIALDCEARFVLTTTPIAAMAGLLGAQAPSLAALRWLATDGCDLAGAEGYRDAAIDGDDVAFLQYTSGSTGAPKGVIVSHGNILHNEAQIARAFGHGRESIGVGWLPLYHDMGLIGNVLQPMCMGFPCTLMSPLDFLKRPMRWLEAVSHFQATTSGGPNFAYALCTRKASEAGLGEAALDLHRWDLAFNGAEPVRVDTMARFAEVFAPHGFRRSAFFPCYGLAEATLIATGGRKDQAPVGLWVQADPLARGVAAVGAQGEDRELVSAGRAAADQRLVIVDPDTAVPRAAYEVGEIWLAGPSVARGYWGRAEATAEAFAARTATDDGPFLRTGDLGFLSADGELFVTGRRKDLLILRGRNLYPQDLEVLVESADRSVRPGCCAAFAVEVDGEDRLVVAAEAELAGDADPRAVAAAIRRALIDGEGVHAHDVVVLGPRSIPKTSSGKIQRQATRAAYLAGALESVRAASAAAPTPGTAAGALAPRLADALTRAHDDARPGLLAQAMRGKLAALLRVDPGQLSADTDLATVGLDSLAAMEAQGWLEAELGVPLSATLLWQHPTITRAAAYLAGVWRPSASVARAPDASAPSSTAERAWPLSPGQQRLWLLDQLSPGVPLYHLQFELHLRGPLDPDALERSLQALVRRHPMLCASFRATQGEPRQVLDREPAVTLHRAALGDLPATARAAALGQLARAQGSAPFDLASGPLVRASLVAMGDGDHALVMTLHHIVADGWSIGVLAGELAALYRADRAGRAAALPPPVSYASWIAAQAQAGASHEAQRAYWAAKLAGLPRLELPTDRPRPRAPSLAGALHRFTLRPDLVTELEALGRRERCTLYVVLVTAWTALLHRYTGQDDFALGTVVAHRDRPEFRSAVGFFAQTLVLRCDAAGTPSFLEMLARMRGVFQDALHHGDLPFEEVVQVARAERGVDNPLFQSCLILESLPPVHLDVPGMVWRPVLPVPDGAVEGTAKFDLSLSLTRGGDGLAAAIEYRTALFDATTVARMADHLAQLLASAVASPEARICELPLVTGDERRELLGAWNAAGAAVMPAPACIHDQIAAQAARTPDAVAVTCAESQLTYAELEARAADLAHHLRTLGVGPDVCVGLCAERSLDMVVGMLAILKAGGAYLPLDPAYPRERLAFMLADAGAGVLLTQRHLAGVVQVPGVQVAMIDDGPRGPGAALPPVAVTPDHLAYVIYTSGSTGKPKGVMVPHATVSSFFAAMDQRIAGPRPGVWLAITSISFDISVLELLWTLARGFHVVVHDDDPGRRPRPGRSPGPRAAGALQLSLFYFANDADQAAGDGYRLLLDGARFADEHGFAAVWTPERHFHAFGGLYPNPSVASAALAALTRRIGIRAGSVVMPLHHPVRVAEEWALVDNLSQGRVGISFASGWHADDFVFAPDAYAQRRERLIDAVDQVRRLWRGDRLTFVNGVGEPTEIRLRPRPLQAELPCWLTAAGNPDTFRSAGRLGVNVLTHLLGQTGDDLARNLAVYRQAWQEAGHPGVGHVTLMLHTFVHPDAGYVRAQVEGPFRRYLASSADLMRGLGKTLGVALDTASPAELDRLVDHAFERYFATSGLFGSPSELRGRVSELHAIGVDEIGCLIDFGIAPQAVLDSLRYLDELRQLGERDTRPGARATIAEQIERHGVTHLQCTPSLARTLVAEPAATAALGRLSRLLVGGEALPAALAGALCEALPGGEVINLYGPTETTIWSATHPVVPDATPGPVVSIGRGIPGTWLYVLDPHGQLVPAGVPGELYIAGRGVTRGYRGRPALTAERFVPDPFQPAAGARMYRTGDRVRWRADGALEFLGRADHQLKVRGVRIEAGEIESTLESLPGVREAVVVAREDEPGDVRLIGYVVAAAGHLDTAALRTALHRRLPEALVPSALVQLAALPLLPNGKVDRKALPAPTARRTAQVAFVAPGSQLEHQLVAIWQQVLKVDQVGVSDNFFDLGGHSLLIVRVHAQLRDRLGLELPLSTLFEFPTIQSLARHLRDQEPAGPAAVDAAKVRANKQLDSLKRQRERARKSS